MASEIRKAFIRRDELKKAKLIVVKVGSAVITRSDNGSLAASRLTSIIEQMAELQRFGARELLLVTSGAVAFGHKKIGDEIRRSMSLRDIELATSSPSASASPISMAKNEQRIIRGLTENRAAAACGQSSLMSFYETMFNYQGVKVAQVLVTKADLLNEDSRNILLSTIRDLLSYNIVPIINTNDAVEDRVIASAKVTRSTSSSVTPDGQLEMTSATMHDIVLEDNDALASLLASELHSDLLILLTNVDGIYTEPPSSATARLLNTYHAPSDDISGAVSNPALKFGQKSTVGAGGMESKIRSALWALGRGTSVVICNGGERNALIRVVNGQSLGTFFVPTSPTNNDGVKCHIGGPTNSNECGQELESIVSDSRRAGQRLASSLSGEQRRKIIDSLADALEDPVNINQVLKANQEDLDEACRCNLAAPLVSRLKLSEAKMATLASGLRQIGATSCDLINSVVKRTLLSKDGLVLSKITCPIGVLLVIFESRPDCLPQLAALAIATGNALLAKGGKEASRSNQALMDLIKHSLAQFRAESACQLLTTREQVSTLLASMASSGRHLVDLIIPRGSNQLVRSIQQQAASVGVPVLGHSEGVCHVYVDESARVEQTIKIVLDAKCNYPAACNAVETLLIHRSHVLANHMSCVDQVEHQSNNGNHTQDQHQGNGTTSAQQNSLFNQLCCQLTANNVKINVGPRLYQVLVLKRVEQLANSMRTEYSSLELTIEMVDSLDQAIEHINSFGSSHTDTIVTNERTQAEQFMARVDSANVFWNASTRFADGYRYGLGAEVGISTGKIHARGPVGADGLLSHKWLLTPDASLIQDHQLIDQQSISYTVGELDARGYIHKSLN